MSKEERIRKLTLLLKELFQFENNDLDFGIYRIINIKRKEISEFIDTELFEIIKEKIKTVEDNTELEKNLESLKKEIENTFGCDIIEAKKKYAETPKVKDYVDMEKEFKVSEKESDIEEEIYDDIISFFSRYYDKGDFISKRRYSKDNKYAIPYNGEEVYLYWANNDQYYIKTAENFRNYSFKAGSIKVDFEIISEDVDVEKNNIKDAEKKFFIFYDAGYDQSNKIVNVKFGYRGLTEDEENTIKDKTDKKNLGKDEVNVYNLERINEKIAIYGLSELQQKHTKMDGSKSDSSELKWHLNKYTTKNTSDYFIHKDLKKFLKQELDFYIKNELLHVDDIDTKENLNINLKRIKVFKEISLKIIEFLAQIEDFQKKLWEKKKFVISTDYCITLDYIDGKYYSQIIENKAQLNEWKNLFSFDIEEQVKKLKGTLLAHGNDDKRIEVLKQNPTLVIDTKFYDIDFKYRLISEIDNLDEKIDGILINSDNFHTLNLLKEKFKNKINCCFIDPPYNTGNDEFLYKDNFMNSSWISMMNDRLECCLYLLNEAGILWCTIDDNEAFNLHMIMEKIVGENNLFPKIVWQHSIQGKGYAGSLTLHHNYVFGLRKTENGILGLLERTEEHNINYSNPDNDSNGPWRAGDVRNALFRPNLIYDIKTPSGKIIKSPPNGWRWSKETLQEKINTGEIIFSDDENRIIRKIYLKNQEGRVPESIWFAKNVGSTRSANSELKNLFGEKIPFDTPKPVELIENLSQISINNKKSTILDFFAGSGTTGHAILNVNRVDEGHRKFILGEMAQYFNSVLKPRILKVIYSDNWKDGKPQDNDGSKKQIIKYQTLEQYEDSLNNIDFREPSTLAKKSKDYVLKYMLEFESKGSNVLINLDMFDKPFEYKIKVDENNEIKEKKVDLIETFNYIYGLDVKTIQKKKNIATDYIIVKGQRNEKDIVVIWRDKTDDFNPEQDKKFIETEVLTEDFDEIFTNGTSLVKEAKSVDEIFKTNMLRG